MVGPSHSTGARHHTPRLPAPSRPASAARALDDCRAGSPRARGRPQSWRTPPRIECTVASLVERSSLLDDKAMLVDGAVEDETAGQTSAENSLARALGSPNGRHQRLVMRTMIQQRRKPSSVQIHKWKRSPSRERDHDRQQKTVTNAANILKGMTEPPQFVDWATTEGEREDFGYAIRSRDCGQASDVDSLPMELELRMATASAGLRRLRPLRAAGTAAVAASVR
jgi:hypothetical protein